MSKMSKKNFIDLFPKDYKPKKIEDTFDDKYVEFKNEGRE